MDKIYTIAIGADMLLAIAPSGDGAISSIEKQISGLVGNYLIAEGTEYQTYDVRLTDEINENENPFWKSGNSGWLTDENNRDWLYAVLA